MKKFISFGVVLGLAQLAAGTAVQAETFNYRDCVKNEAAALRAMVRKRGSKLTCYNGSGAALTTLTDASSPSEFQKCAVYQKDGCAHQQKRANVTPSKYDKPKRKRY